MISYSLYLRKKAEKMILAKWTIIFFGIFLIGVGFLMVLAPINTRKIIKKAASTNLIHYTEISIRLLPAIAMIVYADMSDFPIAFKIFGGIMVVTSIVLYFVP